LIKRIQSLVDEMSQQLFFVLLTSIALVVYGIRGYGYRRELWGDDLELYLHATNRPTPTSGFGRFDHLGLFDSYNNYLIVWIRAFVRLAMLGPDSHFTFNAYLLMTLSFAVITSCTCFIIGTKTSRRLALLSLGYCVLLPFSNLVILAQVNTIIWPLSLFMIVVSATRMYPNSKMGRVSIAVLFFITSLSTLTTVIALAFLGLNLIQSFKRLHRFEVLLFSVTSISFLIQWNSYSPRHNPKLSLISELHKALYNFSPQYIRRNFGTPLIGFDLVIFWLIPMALLTIWVIQANFVRLSSWLSVLSALKLFAGSFLLLFLLIHGNGWLNTHYLFIPASMFWVSFILLFHENRQRSTTGLAIAITSSLFAISISGVYYLL
jgi:hypothetical protein